MRGRATRMLAAGRPRDVVIPYHPRAPQWELHRALARGVRHVLLVWHRRAGKTSAAVNQLIKSALECQLPLPRFAYICPLLKQAKRNAWDGVAGFKYWARDIPGVFFHESDLKVELPNGATIYVVGADNPDALRGTYLDGVVVDEYGQIHPNLRSEILVPALADRRGWEVIAGTPKGRNQFYQLYDRARTMPDTWTVSLHRASDTGLVPADVLAEAKLEQSVELYDQEWECSWLAAAEGTYYARYLIDAETEGRICLVPYDPAQRVVTAWDLGIGDSTAIWWLQRIPGGSIAAIDYHENAGRELAYYAGVIQSKPYLYHEHLVPHDADHRSVQTGLTYVQFAATLGLTLRTVPTGGFEEGIEATRRILPRMLFDREKTKDGRDALMAYTRRYNKALEEFMDSAQHDWSSHGSDALRVFATDEAFGRARTPFGGGGPQKEEYALA